MSYVFSRISDELTRIYARVFSTFVNCPHTLDITGLRFLDTSLDDSLRETEKNKSNTFHRLLLSSKFSKYFVILAYHIFLPKIRGFIK